MRTVSLTHVRHSGRLESLQVLAGGIDTGIDAGGGTCVASGTAQVVGAPSIYAVDDDEDLVELYTTILRDAGYTVQAFNDRETALDSLKKDEIKPQLLITDYRGSSMAVEPFMRCCLAAHPTLRILVASGFDQNDAPFSSVSPDRFIRKPFTSEEFLSEVQALLAHATIN